MMVILPRMDASLTTAIAAVPPGRWAVGVSGGADSVALLLLLTTRADISPVVVHLDHELRGDASRGDAEFVLELGERLRVEVVTERRGQWEPMVPNLSANASARYRQLRLALFAREVGNRELAGVILAHHADDQAETIFQRLLRGSGFMGLSGMKLDTTVSGLRILRPLLGTTRDQLRAYLNEMRQSWREDASNDSDAYQRNRVRRALAGDASLRSGLIELGDKCGELRHWVESTAPVLQATFAVGDLADQSEIFARFSASRWLEDMGVASDDIDPGVIDRLLEMVRDAASSGRQQFPSGVTVVRRKGVMSAM